MERGRLSEAAGSGRILVADGAWGTQLQAKGLAPGECPEQWCVEHPERVAEIARAYIEAGADLIETNSFGGNRLRLADHGLGDRASELNEAAARISRAAAGEVRWVVGSVGPSGRLLMMGDVGEADLYEAFLEQSLALLRGGVDAICVETMSATDEAAIAVRAARDAGAREVICTFTFSPAAAGEHRTMMGHDPAEAARAALEAGADIIGANCVAGGEAALAVVRAMRAAEPSAPILVQPNAGLPTIVRGQQSWPDAPETFAAWLPRLAEAGATIIGGCCGTTPAHVRALRAAADRWMRERAAS
ncbi:MAG: homocysteine S-methyltransferase family protein [Kiritimatiellae bacterium]|nr:homocysteine S-methyltransferase family protein [Kiritimatiellia bacterium]